MNNDPVMKMIIEANEHTGIQPRLTPPTGFGIPGVDLREVPQDGGGRSLYDQYLETVSTIKDANGMTYRDRLAVLAEETFALNENERWGNRLHKGARAEAISKIKNEFEVYAKEWMENNSKSYAYLKGRDAMLTRRQEAKDANAVSKSKANNPAELLGLD